MQIDLWLTLAVLAGAVYLFVSEKLATDVVALLVLASLLVLGLVSPTEALSGFSSEATITVAAMFVLSAGLQRSGALEGLGEALARIRWSWLFALVMMVVIAFISAFVNNTAAVAVFLPLVIAAAISQRRAPSKLLIPLSYAAQFGGVCTLVGTSTNLLVNSLAVQSGREGFGLFEFAPLGIIFVGIGITYLMLFGRFLLPDLGVPEVDDGGLDGIFLVELLVPEGSPVIGTEAMKALPEDMASRMTLKLVRDGAIRPRRNTSVEAGDRLLLRGEWSLIQRLRKQLKLEFNHVARDLEGDVEAARLHAKVMIAPGSHLVGHTLASLRFGHVYRARVRGMQRQQRAPFWQHIDHAPLAVGDILLVDSTEAALSALRDDANFVVLAERAQPRVDKQRAWTSFLVMAAVIGAAGLGLLPIVASAILGCVALIVLRCLEPDEAYAAVDWRVVMLLAGVLPLGIALERSGGADWLAHNAIGLVGHMGPVVSLAVIYLMTSVLTEMMSNNAAAVLIVPIAIATAESLGVDAKPFLVAVAFAASTAFATPVGYQTNAMVHAAGGYKFSDFMRIGLPLTVIFWVTAVLLIPVYFPF
ncbi:SLC13 family permease [Lysobacter sp. A03]|uniref:SLC13 family permease n=1 Tax=Lysobacter sp. A03 TaxID=1199154 RepID=UPI0005B70F47|nr:SLC13 family permease [Lysobacter sp. A03]KIQ97299.1 Sulfate permease, Trk-type [Lysobacter sp. A03]